MANLLWLQGGACSGNTMSFLNAEEPSAVDLVTDFGINILWHPSLGVELGDNLQKILRDCASGKLALDIFVFEGTVVNAPGGTGEWNRFAGRPMKQWVRELADAATFVVAVGDCATWGGIPATAPNPSDSEGLQFLKRNHGGFLGKDFKSKSGLPVINIPGCPAHPDWITQIVVAVATGRGGDIGLDDLQRPKTFFQSFTQTGCTRNMHFAYKVSATEFGQRKGCLFYDLGCRGPMTHSPCNRILWNRQSSKTRAGMPCLGCTEPEFPFFELNPGTVFKTQTVMGVPKDLPAGVDKKGYIALTGAAKNAAPAWAEKIFSSSDNQSRGVAIMAVQTLDISPVGRVEGDLDVRVDIENGVVKNAWTSAELFRGFEIILRDKDPQAGLVVTPRACGICGASHLTCAAWALDTAWATEVPRNAILARNIGQLTESLQSQPRYFYGLYAIDMTNKKYRNSKYYEEAVKRFAPFTGKSYEIGVTVSGKPVEIYALFGGQWPHSSYMVPGGVMCAPTLSDITRSWALLEYYKKTWLESCWLGCTLERYEQIKSYDDFQKWLDESPAHANSDLGFYWRMGLDIGLDKYGGGVGKYVSWGYLPHEDKYQKPTIEGRNAALIMKSGVYDGKADTHVLMSQERARENMTHAWYDEGGADVHPFDRTTKARQKNTTDFNAGYSWATAVNHDQLGRLEAGPFARQLVAGGKHGESWQHYDPLILDMYKKMGGPSLHLRQIARMHETVKLYRQTEHCLKEFRLNDPWYIKPRERDGRGWGATEAIRGALCHWIEVKDGKIKNYQIIAPTTWNVGPRDSKGIRGPIEEALMGAPIADPTDPVEVGHVARSFDSCLVCTVHAHDAKSGKELARFRIG